MISFGRCRSDPLVSHGRHFGRAVHALCNVQALLTNGLLRLGELAEEPEESFTAEYVTIVTNLMGIIFADYSHPKTKTRAPCILRASSDGTWPRGTACGRLGRRCYGRG
jgi:hypothetical protein